MKTRFLFFYKDSILYRDIDLEFIPVVGMNFMMKFDHQSQLDPYHVRVVNVTYYLDEFYLSILLGAALNKAGSTSENPKLIIHVREA